MIRDKSARNAADAVVAQIIDAVDTARRRRGMTIDALGAQAGICERAMQYAWKLQHQPNLASLLALTNAVGLKLDIRVRPKDARA